MIDLHSFPIAFWKPSHEVISTMSDEIKPHLASIVVGIIILIVEF